MITDRDREEIHKNKIRTRMRSSDNIKLFYAVFIIILFVVFLGVLTSPYYEVS